MRKIRQLDENAADFVEEIKILKKTYRDLKDKKKIHEIEASIIDIENYLAGRYAEPTDSF